MVHATPDGALGVASAAAPSPGIWPLCEYHARLGGRMSRLPGRRKPAHRDEYRTPIEDLLTAGAWRNPFLDGMHPDAPKSPRITIYNG